MKVQDAMGELETENISKLDHELITTNKILMIQIGGISSLHFTIIIHRQ